MWNKKNKRFKKNINFFIENSSYSKKKCLIFFVFLFLFLIFIHSTSVPHYLKNSFYSFSEPVQVYFSKKGDFLANFFQGFFQSARLKEKNEWLLKENRQLIGKNAELEFFQQENKELREMLELKQEEDFSLEVAQVIGRESSSVITINKGDQDGIKTNFPVINGEKVLIGRVFQIYEGVSKVQLLNSENSILNAFIINKNVYGILKGSNSSYYLFDLIPEGSSIEVGDLVVTSNLGGGLPDNLLIGTVKEIENSERPSFLQAKINPFYSFQELNNVFIILQEDF